MLEGIRLSTVDPVAARRQRQLSNEDRPGVAGGLIRLALRGLLWFLFGFGLADSIRYPASVPYLTRDTYPAHELPALGFALFCVTFALALIDSIAGSPRAGFGTGTGVRSAVGFVGAALGILKGTSDHWVKAPDIGTYVDAAGRSRGPWDSAAWIDWSSQYWVPAVLVLLAILFRLVGIRIDRQKRIIAARTEAILDKGVRVAGVIADVRDTGLEIRGKPRLRIVVKFTDHVEVDRWVTKTGLFDPLLLPRRGDPAVVWFDPVAPGDEKAIPIALGTFDDVGDPPLRIL